MLACVNMKAQYTIGALARAAGVPTTTVRYYEREELLIPESRSESHYRHYTERSLLRLQFIRTAQTNGFTLDDIRRLLQFQDGAPDACGEVQILIEARLGDLAERLKRLRSLQAVLRTSLEACHRGQASGRCEVLDGLSEGRPAARTRPGRAPREKGRKGP